MKKSTLLFGLGLLVLVWIVSISGGSNGVFDFEKNPSISSTIYFVYSPTCPHCHELANYLKTLNLSVNVKAVTNGKFLQTFLQNDGITWRYGVPILVGISETKVIAIEGYPDATQILDGYFVSQSYEQTLCTNQGGFENGFPYDFCNLPNGFLLGNQNSVNYLLDYCSENECKKL
ncbi:MAG: hypothetical protein GOU98_04180 [Candidatus Altiarchaeota archaeon]|nr:hypothetical protein [Candidatus Altiarchaeota archaeon]